MADSVTTYVTNDEIDEYFQSLLNDPTFTYTDIPLGVRGDDTVAGSAFDYIRQCIDYVFCDPDAATKTYYLNGEGEPDIFVPEAPITNIDEVVIIQEDGSETSLTLTEPDRQVWWESSIALLSTRRNSRYTDKVAEELNNEFGYANIVFPRGLENIRVVGNFGIDVPPMAKLAQLMVMQKQMTFVDPSTYQKIGNIVREQIGRYEYQLGVIGFDKSSKYVSLDSYIETIIDKLPKINTYSYEAI